MRKENEKDRYMLNLLYWFLSFAIILAWSCSATEWTATTCFTRLNTLSQKYRVVEIKPARRQSTNHLTVSTGRGWGGVGRVLKQKKKKKSSPLLDWKNEKGKSCRNLYLPHVEQRTPTASRTPLTLQAPSTPTSHTHVKWRQVHFGQAFHHPCQRFRQMLSYQLKRNFHSSLNLSFSGFCCNFFATESSFFFSCD